MPEGPEVYALSVALNKIGINNIPYGKHIYFTDKKEDWSFGLQGKVSIDISTKIITHQPISSNWKTGFIKSFNTNEERIQQLKLGIDWMTSNNIQQTLEKYKNSSRTLASILLDQSIIAGIGVAWGSEILHSCGYKPNDKMNEINVKKLATCIIEIREYIREKYIDYIQKWDYYEFVNGWFGNLYKLREMKVYKKEKSIEISGRTWWI